MYQLNDQIKELKKEFTDEILEKAGLILKSNRLQSCIGYFNKCDENP